METRLISLRIFASMVFLNKKSILGTFFFYFEIPFQTIGNFTDRIFQRAFTNHNDDANLKVAQDLSTYEMESTKHGGTVFLVSKFLFKPLEISQIEYSREHSQTTMTMLI